MQVLRSTHTDTIALHGMMLQRDGMGGSQIDDVFFALIFTFHEV